jgi:hypothetical protein
MCKYNIGIFDMYSLLCQPLMINCLPYLHFVGPVCVRGVVVFCAICFGELMSRGNVNFMSVCMRVRVSGSM